MVTILMFMFIFMSQACHGTVYIALAGAEALSLNKTKTNDGHNLK